MNTEERLHKISSLLLLSRDAVKSQEEPDLYPVEDALQMALDFLTPCIEEKQEEQQ